MTHQVRDPQPGKDQMAAQSIDPDDQQLAKPPIGTLRLFLVLELPGFAHGKAIQSDQGPNQAPRHAIRLWDPPYKTESAA